MLALHQIAYAHPDRTLLFSGIDLHIHKSEKIALIGKNGSGKSTLLQLIAGQLLPSQGNFSALSQPYYIPQIFGQFNQLTIAEALGISAKRDAFHAILQGNATDENLETLNDDWDIEDRCRAALDFWELHGIGPDDKMERLSGGQQTKVFLSGILIHEPDFVLLDEPSNHLDRPSRLRLMEWIRNTKATMLLVSHDRELLDLVTHIAELIPSGISNYSGNYTDYLSAKQTESEALEHDLHDKQRDLRKAKAKEKETNERQQKLDSRGKGKQEKSGVARIMMNALRNKAENSSAKLKSVHSGKIQEISQALRDLRSSVHDIGKMDFGFGDSQLHKGKVLFEADKINIAFNETDLWEQPLDFQITSGERLAIEGRNGSGKTTLVKMLAGQLDPACGKLYRNARRLIYLDQQYSYLDNSLSVYQQAQKSNTENLPEHEIRMRLDRFLFPKNQADKSCNSLSGGERMRLVLCCLTLSRTSPDVIILDEPTNNLDLYNLEILASAIRQYKGTLVVVSHDVGFLSDVGIGRSICV